MSRIEAVAAALRARPAVGQGLAIKRVEAFEEALRQHGYHVVPLSPDHPDHPDKVAARRSPFHRSGHSAATIVAKQRADGSWYCRTCDRDLIRVSGGGDPDDHGGKWDYWRHKP